MICVSQQELAGQTFVFQSLLKCGQLLITPRKIKESSIVRTGGRYTTAFPTKMCNVSQFLQKLKIAELSTEPSFIFF